MVQEKKADEAYCSSCGAIIKKEAEICPKCGVRQKRNSHSGNGKQVNWATALVLSILLPGIDRIYMGQVGLGILKIITWGGCGIWWVIDIILIATKSHIDGVEWEF